MFRSLMWLPPGWYKQEYDYNNNVQICRIVLTHYNRILFTPARRQPPSGRNTLVVSTWLNSLNTLVCICWLLGAFAKLRKSTIRFVMSVRQHGTRLPLNRFWWNLIFEFSRKICRQISSFIKIRREQRVLYMKTFSYFLQCLAEFF